MSTNLTSFRTKGQTRGGRLPRLVREIAARLEKLAAIVCERRIPYRIARSLSRQPGQSRIWRFAHHFYTRPVSFFRVFGFFPLPVQTVQYTEFRHGEFQPVRGFPHADAPKCVQHDGAWSRWTTELPDELRDPGIRSCHTVFLRDGFADASGNVFSNEGSLVIGASLPVRRDSNQYYTPTKLRPPHYRGDCLAVVTSSLQDNYYHWLMEVLPRIHMLRAQQLEYDKLYLKSSLRFQKETLDLLGVGQEQCIRTGDYEFVSAANLIVPFHEIKAGVEHPRWVCDFLRKSFLPQLDNSLLDQPSPRLYIIRPGAKWRRVTNESEILRILEPLGFQCVSLDELPFLEQVKLFHRAEAVIAPHGAALANLVFSERDTKVIEFQPRKIQDTYFRLCRTRGLDFYYLQSTTGPTNPVNNQQQLTIDPPQLQETLHLAGIH